MRLFGPIVGFFGRSFPWARGRKNAPLLLTDYLQRSSDSADAQDRTRLGYARLTPTMPAEHIDAHGLALGMPSLKPKESRRARIYKVFDTALPVENRHNLAGRAAEIMQLVSDVLQGGKHAVILGNRGSGKTSLARVFGDLADEAGCIAIYHSASGDASFKSLFQTYVDELFLATRRRRPDRRMPELSGGAGDATLMAAFLSELGSQRVFLILDEFDRIELESTKNEVASLMKLLSDARSVVQLIVVGIASTVDDLLAGHLSLRRHMAAVHVGPVNNADLGEMILDCCARVQLTIASDALEAIIASSLGSPYHARLYGLASSLDAERSLSSKITASNVSAGIQKSLSDWSMTSNISYLTFKSALNLLDDGFVFTCIAVNAAYSPSNTIGRICVEVAAQDRSRTFEAKTRVDKAVSMLEPALNISSDGSTIAFKDALAPQFLLQMAAFDIFDSHEEQLAREHRDMADHAIKLLQGAKKS